MWSASCFQRVLTPLRTGRKPGESAGEAAAPNYAADVRCRGFCMRCLLVEDEKKVADFVARGLRAERFAIDVAYDGDAGWNLASNSEYDLIIVDLMLPGMSGTEILHRIRKKPSNTPVLVLTARDETPEKVRHFEAGADDYLTKP